MPAEPMQSPLGAVFSMEHRELVRDFLGLCDLVKFAVYQPSQLEVDRGVGLCRRFIDETAPQPETGGDEEKSMGPAL